MDLFEFIETTKKELDLFKENWLKNHAMNPENYPLDLGENNDGLWFEQFTMWDSEENKDLAGE